jgi:hypothetical protein
MALDADRLARRLVADVANFEVDPDASTEEQQLAAMRALATAIIDEIKQAEVAGTASSVTVGAGTASVTGTLT